MITAGKHQQKYAQGYCTEVGASSVPAWHPRCGRLRAPLSPTRSTTEMRETDRVQAALNRIIV